MSYNSDLQDIINKLTSVTSQLNLTGALSELDKAYKPISQTAGVQEFLSQIKTVGKMCENSKTVEDMIATSNSVSKLAASIHDSVLSQVSFPSAALDTLTSLNSVTSNITFENNIVRMAAEARQVLDSMPTFYPNVNESSDNNDSSISESELKEDNNTTLPEQSQPADEVLTLSSNEFVKKYAYKFVLYVLTNLVSIFINVFITSDAPSIINAIEVSTLQIENSLEENHKEIVSLLNQIIDISNQNHTEEFEIRNREIEVINEQNRLLQIIADSLAAPQSTSEHLEELPHPNDSENP